jgi:hypothetical protein
MPITATCPWGPGTCYEGEIEGYRVHAQIMDRQSKVGIAEGRIVQFYVSKTGLFGLRDCELYYNRGWDSAPPFGMLRSVVEQAVGQIDGKRVEWALERKRYEDSLRNEPVRLTDKE